MATFYLHRKAGDDGKDGTSIGNAKATLSAALGLGFSDGDTLKIKGGYTYSGAAHTFTRGIIIEAWDGDIPGSEPIISFTAAALWTIAVGAGMVVTIRQITFDVSNVSGAQRVISITPSADVTMGQVSITNCNFNMGQDPNDPDALIKVAVTRPDGTENKLETPVRIQHCNFSGCYRAIDNVELHKDYNSIAKNIFYQCGNTEGAEADCAIKITRSSLDSSDAIICIIDSNYFYGCGSILNNQMYDAGQTASPTIQLGTHNVDEDGVNSNMFSSSNSVPDFDNASAWTEGSGWTQNTGATTMSLSSAGLNCSAPTGITTDDRHRVGIKVNTPVSAGNVKLILASATSGGTENTIMTITSEYTAGWHYAAPHRVHQSTDTYIILKPSASSITAVFGGIAFNEINASGHPGWDLNTLLFTIPEDSPDRVAASFGSYSTGTYSDPLNTAAVTVTMAEGGQIFPLSHRQVPTNKVKSLEYSAYDVYDIVVNRADYFFVEWNDMSANTDFGDVSAPSTTLQLLGGNQTIYIKVVSLGDIPGYYNLIGKDQSTKQYGGQARKMTAGKHDIVIEQGADFKRVFTWKDSAGAAINITGYSAAMMIKKRKSDASGVAIFNKTNSNAEIALGGAAGTITIDIGGADTAGMDFDWGYYDIELTDGSSNITRLLEGKVRLSKQVTY